MQNKTKYMTETSFRIGNTYKLQFRTKMKQRMWRKYRQVFEILLEVIKSSMYLEQEEVNEFINE